jgi:hypothetical protein
MSASRAPVRSGSTAMGRATQPGPGEGRHRHLPWEALGGRAVRKDVFGAEPVCRVLTQHSAPIAPGTYYAAKSRPPSARAVRTGEPLWSAMACSSKNSSAAGVATT